MKYISFAFILLILMTGLTFAQPANQIVSAEIISSTNKFKAGTSHNIALEIEIKDPFHINAKEPSEDYLIPTTVEFKSKEGITFGKQTFPDPKLKQFAFSESPLAVYEGTVYIYSSLTISPEYAGEDLTIEGNLGYQACDDATCLAPEEVIFKQTFPIASPDEEIKSINRDVFAQSQTSAEKQDMEGAEEGGFGKTIEGKGILLTFILVFIGGLALNLTPCVYPLIPITISYFGGQAEGKKGSLITHAIIYVFGMAITYSMLGVIAALTGSLFGAALQNPWVLIGIAIILVGLSLSMFDMYEIRIPAFLSNFAGGSRQGFFGTFFMGLTVGIVAAPCIGPFVLALLTYVGEKGDIFLGFGLFFVLAVGLGVPFVFLAIFSGSISKIPRSGAWMVWVRAIFGFVLIALAIYFLQPLFPNSLLYHLSLGLTMLIGGVYMAWIEPTEAQGKIFPIVRNLVGVVFFVLALFFTASGIQSYIDNSIANIQLTAQNTQQKDKIAWSEYSETKLAEAAQQNKPVLIDFYADWCIPCKELDKFTFSKPEVVKMSKKFVMLKVDLTTTDDPKSKTLKEKFEIRGVPTLVFLTPENSELENLRVVGFMEKGPFLQRMEKALKAGKQG